MARIHEPVTVTYILGGIPLESDGNLPECRPVFDDFNMDGLRRFKDERITLTAMYPEDSDLVDQLLDLINVSTRLQVMVSDGSELETVVVITNIIERNAAKLPSMDELYDFDGPMNDKVTFTIFRVFVIEMLRLPERMLQ